MRPEMLQTPLLPAAAQRTELQNTGMFWGGRGGRKSPSVSTFQVAEFPKIKRNDNFPSQSGAEGKETRHAGLVFCVRNACVL